MSEKLDIGILSREKLFTKLIPHFHLFICKKSSINWVKKSAGLGSITLNDEALII